MITLHATRRLWSLRPARAVRRKPIPTGRRTSLWIARVEAVTLAWRRAIEAWVRRRDDIDAFRDLDAHARRDLGIDACEAASFGREADGAVERTRLRVAWRTLVGARTSSVRIPEL